MRIVVDDLTHPDVLVLLELHLRAAFENSPPDLVFALDVAGLRDPAVTVLSAWEDDELLGFGALKQLDPVHGEIKSMRTAPSQLRRGVAAMLLDRLIGDARQRGYRRVSLETGSSEAFAAAHRLYERAGFTRCAPFAGYSDEQFARYYTLGL